MPISVLCVDDSADITRLLDMAINAEEDMKSVGTVEDAEKILSEVQEKQPDVLLLDLTMPGPGDPMGALRKMAETNPETRTIIFSGYDDTALMDKALEAGAWGFVSKHLDINDVLDAIRRVAGGEAVTMR